jgi:hypothetical protein
MDKPDVEVHKNTLPAGWAIEKVDDITLRVTDPNSSFGPLVLHMPDVDIARRIFYRLCQDLIA